MKTSIKPIRELSTAEITDSALTELWAKGYNAWRSNNIAVRGRKFIGKRGASDIQGYQMKTGIALYCEVKKIGDKLSNDQIEFLRSAKKAGAICLIACQEMNSVTLKEFKED